ncbi:MAG: alpha/beta hydrolase [Pirellulales bacterium]
MNVKTCFSAVLACAIIWITSCADLSAAEPKHAFTHDRGVTYSSPGGAALKAEVYTPKGAGPFPGVLVVHGGAWRTGSRVHMSRAAERLAERGYAAVAIDYRLAPKHPYPAQIEDCQAAVRWMRSSAKKYRIDTERIGGYGYSAGGHLVALLGVLSDDAEKNDAEKNDGKNDHGNGTQGGATQPNARLQAVVAGGAPVNFELLPRNTKALAYWLGGTRGEKPDVYRQASPTAHITADDPPMFFFHGSADALVPQISPMAMVGLLTAAKVPAKLHVVEKAGHIGAMFDAAALEASIAFFDERLKPVEAAK